MAVEVTTKDLESLFRPLAPDEVDKAEHLIPVVIASLRQEAAKVGKDLDGLLDSGDVLADVFKSVVCDVTARALLTSTSAEPMSQFSQSALGYSVSGTYLVPGGGLFIKKSELSRLGLNRQRMRMVDFYAD